MPAPDSPAPMSPGGNAWHTEARRGLLQNAAIAALTLALLAAVWLWSREAPSAGGGPTPAPAATRISPNERFRITAFPTAPSIEGAVTVAPSDRLRLVEGTPVR